MPKRDDAPLGAPCWVDLLTTDPERSRDFYGRLFGWTVEDPGEEYGGYVNFLFEGIHVAGCMRNDGTAGVPDLWSVYLATADADATVARVVEHHGQVMVPPMDVMQLGRMAVVVDVGGAVIGMWQPGLHRGFGIFDEPGTPAWFELHTRDYDASIAFYCDVFGWTTQVASDTPRVPLHHVGRRRRAAGGRHGLERVPPRGGTRGLVGVLPCGRHRSGALGSRRARWRGADGRGGHTLRAARDRG